jgi:hypothetical protein
MRPQEEDGEQWGKVRMMTWSRVVALGEYYRVELVMIEYACSHQALIGRVRADWPLVCARDG